jgi:hypothetical protein
MELMNMVKVVVIDPKDELILHNMPIESKDSVRRLNTFCRAEEEDRGRDLVRLLICEGTVRVMDRCMEIPVPVYPALRRKL